MKQKSGPDKAPAEQVLKDIRRQTRRQYSAEEHIYLSKLGDDLFRFVSLPRHLVVLHQAVKPYFREDHFSGGRPFCSGRGLAKVLSINFNNIGVIFFILSGAPLQIKDLCAGCRCFGAAIGVPVSAR
jgi:hypothetical protein